MLSILFMEIYIIGNPESSSIALGEAPRQDTFMRFRWALSFCFCAKNAGSYAVSLDWQFRLLYPPLFPSHYHPLCYRKSPLASALCHSFRVCNCHSNLPLRLLDLPTINSAVGGRSGAAIVRGGSLPLVPRLIPSFRMG